jgi:catechol 2,3-dioxygenase-like lactoylglutathione lyase family enzyme
MHEIPKPLELAKRGGCWFESGGVQVHLGVEEEFRPAKKAHPALKCADYDGLVVKLRAAGIEVRENRDLPGVRRCYVSDPFGNRIELIMSVPGAGPKEVSLALEPVQPSVDGRSRTH